MNKPMTLHEYLQMRNLQRRKELFMINEAKHAPTPMKLDKDNKIDSLMIQILDYVRHLINQGPLFSKFQLMMQHLHKLFMRQMEDVQKVTVKSRIHSNNKYMEEVKKANQKLNQYIKQCEKQKQDADKKLEKLIDKNKDIRKVYARIPKKQQKQEIIDNFDDQIVQKPAKIEKVTKIDFNEKPKPQIQDKTKKENMFKPQIQDKVKKENIYKPLIQDKFRKENVVKPIQVDPKGKINLNQKVKVKTIEIDDKFDQDQIFEKPKKVEKIDKVPKIVVNFDKVEESQEVKTQPKEEYIFAEI